MKRIIAVLLAVMLAAGVAGCGTEKARIRELEERIAALEAQLNQQNTSDGTVEQKHAAPEEQSIMDNPEAKRLRQEISTVEQAIAWLDERFPELWMSAHLNDGISDLYWLAPGEEVVLRSSEDPVGRSCIVNAMTYLLGDDMQISTVLGFWHDETGGCPLKAINCIKTESGYQFVDPVLQMQGDGMSRYGALLPQAQTGSMEEYVRLVLEDMELKTELDSLYLFENGGYIEFLQEPSGWTTVQLSDAVELYINEENHISPERWDEMRYGHIQPENIGQYQLSSMLGGTTLTAQEAYALVDAPAETVKEQVKTAADLLMYMLAARIGDNGGCYCDSWDGYTWHTNFTAKEVMERKLSNCGASANLANYLLEGDYDEVGFILHAYDPGNGGGHVYNYFLYERNYYIVDFSWYIFSNYQTDQDFPVMKLERLEDYDEERCKELFGDVSLILAHTSTGRHLPNIFGEEFGDNHYYIPAGAEYSLLYESGSGYLLGEMPLDKNYYDWTKFQ